MKDKWVKCLVSDLISSEESDEENDSIVVKPLPWRAQKVTEFFKKLDVLIDEEKTSQAKRQRKDCWNHLDQNQLAMFQNGPA